MSSSRSLRVLAGAFLATLLVTLGAATPAHAGDVEIQVTQIQATNRGAAGIDPALKPLAGDLSGYSYKAYHLLRRRTQRCGAGQPKTYALDGGRTLTVTPEKGSGSSVSLQLLVTDRRGRKIIGQRVTIQRGGTYLLGMPPESNGDRLFAAVTVG